MYENSSPRDSICSKITSYLSCVYFYIFANLGPPKYVEHEQFREELKKVDNYVSYYLSYQISNFEKIKELFLSMCLLCFEVELC